ncbi:CTP synthetase [Aliiroseovarius crassostreae]|uniref:CTP synthetase n=1 Tax=Aliiroseovarius crassostreae TaxID=154981 RepID=UPI0022025126|nr:CTP synthetase [Aliiroseovarius crassostreae]UWP88447.1 CTP synthetase [Aliiroseovarius crassostreae]UWP91610.1 CTP synthetase [Aliiroseovarius crassostreae]UWQ01100.1 CTP synthetase [Aliiroseovarius crassostreae]
MKSPLFKLVMTFYGIIGSTVASVLVVLALVNGITGLWWLLGAAAIGFILGFPVSYYVARAMMGD